MRKRKYIGQAQPLFITVIVIIDVQLKRHVTPEDDPYGSKHVVLIEHQ